ncbi:MAG: phosphate ABC transporter permease subunit PstC [Clostridiales bacterium]
MEEKTAMTYKLKSKTKIIDDEYIINKKENKKIPEKIIEAILFGCAAISVLSVAVITIFIFYRGVPAIIEIGLFDFILEKTWRPLNGEFGILAMIIASIIGSFGAIAIGGLIGIFTSVFLAEIAPKFLLVIFKPAIELLAGIPSVVYGFFALVVIVPIIDDLFGGGGNSLLAVIIVLAVMILPTIINISEVSIKAVPREYKEGSLALGASHIETIFKVILPAAKSGILASVVLGFGRAVGETMAVILVCGNTVQIPNSIFDRVRTMTANIALEMSYAHGLHQEALFATGVILFTFIMLINLALNLIVRRVGEV